MYMNELAAEKLLQDSGDPSAKLSRGIAHATEAEGNAAIAAAREAVTAARRAREAMGRFADIDIGGVLRGIATFRSEATRLLAKD